MNFIALHVYGVPFILGEAWSLGSGWPSGVDMVHSNYVEWLHFSVPFGLAGKQFLLMNESAFQVMIVIKYRYYNLQVHSKRFVTH